MNYKIVLDSCGEIPENLKQDERFQSVPLGLEVGDYHILDDENFNQAEFLMKVAQSPLCPKSSCPSPELFMEAYHKGEAEHVYVVTLSSHLSGSHNSAELGKQLYLEKYGDKKIAVIDSESASCGETQIALKAMELEETGLGFEEIVSALLAYRDEMKTYFVLDNLETLRKNGRLTGVKALVASTLSIKPVMGATGGKIIQLGQAIGIKKALQKMVDMIVKNCSRPQEKRLMIAHCNCLERAQYVQKLLEEKTSFQEIRIMDTAGVSSMYANDGGIIVTV